MVLVIDIAEFQSVAIQGMPEPKTADSQEKFDSHLKKHKDWLASLSNLEPLVTGERLILENTDLTGLKFNKNDLFGVILKNCKL